MTELVINYLENITPLGDGIKEAFRQRFRRIECKKGTILLKEGEVCRTGYFVVKGMARLYYIFKDKEISSRFIDVNSIAVSYFSFFTQKPSFEYLDVLEDSVLLAIEHDELNSIYEEFPEFYRTAKIILEKAHIASEERSMILRKLPARERYKIMFKRWPEIFQKASTEQIASYLGITRETLCRIRSGK